MSSDLQLAISPHRLASLIGTPGAPWIIDVRRREVFDAAERMIAGALWRDHRAAETWAAELPPGPLVVYCVHGHQVSQGAVALLGAAGRPARYLAGGIAAFMTEGGATLRRSNLPCSPGGGHWVTSDPPPRGALACAWLIRRFIDPLAKIHLIDSQWAEAAAREIDGTPFALAEDDAPFQSMIEIFDLRHPKFADLAEPLAAGLDQVLDGLLRLHGPRDALLGHAVTVFDALFARP